LFLFYLFSDSKDSAICAADFSKRKTPAEKTMNIEDMVQIATIFTKAGDPTRDFFLGAVGLRKDGAAVIARNQTAVGERFLSGHAEARLARKLGVFADMVLVVRITKNNQYAMAKPCKYCENILRSRNVKRVFYTTGSDPFGSDEPRIERLW
jgi:tRNA(Arg) A34 adenosine deaminase TadA